MTNIGLALAATGLFISLLLTTDRIRENDGLGYDGAAYAGMMTDGLEAGTANTALRPLVVLINRAVFRAFELRPIDAFVVTNIAFSFLLAFALAALLAHEQVPLAWRAIFVLNVALCISTAQMYSHYPVQVDLGALAFLVLAVHFALAGPAWAASAAAVAAVASREFGIAAVLFVLHREVRLGRPLRGALVCAPALAVFTALRVAASDAPGGGMITPADLLGNLRLWGDPMFAAFVAYFVCTVFGGLAAWLLAQPRRLVAAVRAEPELATFLVPIVLVSAFTPDIWRYLAFLLPGVAVLFARLTRDQRHRVLVGSGITAFTLFTQEPFRRITDNIYFGEWFPYYDWFPVEGPPPGMADWWLRRLALTAGALGLLVALARLTRGRQRVAGTLAV